MGQVGLSLLVTLLPKLVFYGNSVNFSNNWQQHMFLGSRWLLLNCGPDQVSHLLCHALIWMCWHFTPVVGGPCCWTLNSMCNTLKFAACTSLGISVSAMPLLYYLMLYTLESSIYVEYGENGIFHRPLKVQVSWKNKAGTPFLIYGPHFNILFTVWRNCII